jgi:hypothetical protein
MCKVLHPHWLAFDNDLQAVEKTREHIQESQPMRFTPEAEQRAFAGRAAVGGMK